MVFLNAFESVNLLKESEYEKDCYITETGSIAKADVNGGYYVSNKVVFNKDISFNAAFLVKSEGYSAIATYAVYRASDNSVIRVGQLGGYTNTEINSMPQIKYNEDTDKDTYVRICITTSNFEVGSVEQWDVRYGSYVPGGYIGKV